LHFNATQVKLMRSIRHPHLLTFYGAGVDSDSRAYLVTELMSGSLRSTLLDASVELPWFTRLTFASDVAHGMSYLHERGMVHRDLKADNCFLDGKSMRVKVADFGTGHISARMANKGLDRPVKRFSGTFLKSRSLDTSTRAATRTMSTGGGSLLWMAPERLLAATEERVNETDAKAGDVYR
jgi:serine/threonine protein kinase